MDRGEGNGPSVVRAHSAADRARAGYFKSAPRAHGTKSAASRRRGLVKLYDPLKVHPSAYERQETPARRPAASRSVDAANARDNGTGNGCFACTIHAGLPMHFISDV